MEPIAIIGIGCRFPGAKNPEAFWRLLCNGEDAITEVPKDRWDVDQYYNSEPGIPGKISTRWGGFLEQVDQFDPGFFGISPREVERMDPQQRLVLEVAWEAIENAGLAPDSLSGSQTGVFVGIGNYDYCRLLNRDISRVNAYDGTGNTLSIAANRLSYTLNLRGPSVVVETACSSSLVAVHFACRSLQDRESDLCLVGGVSLMLSPEPFITYSHARMMAADGRCKTFDARADGYVRGEGGGVVVLKRLTDALKDGDRIQAVIRGTAINQDGLSNGLTAPNGPSQQAVIRKALSNAGVSPAQISYVEAHGTGTSLGDPIEYKSLKAVLMQERQADHPCWLGSVKTNIGHLEAAAGIASVIKVVLSLQHQEIPPHLHLQQVNPYIALDGTSFAIPTTRQPWTPATGSRLAGISAFGFGGTNCHAILEEAHPEFRQAASSTERVALHPVSSLPKAQSADRFLHLLTLSAKSEQALQELAQSYCEFLPAHPEFSLADICFTANTGRSHFNHRLAVVANSTEQLRERLAAFVAGQQPAELVHGTLTRRQPTKIAFLFTGQGSQYINMGRQLYETQPVFREAIDRCDQILRAELDQPLLSVLYPEAGTTSPIDQTAYTQPALFALEYALVQLWTAWGILPSVVMGHSVGEYVAACVAGVFSLEDGLKLIAARARLMQSLPADGAMVAVFANEQQVQAAIQPYWQQVSIAAVNGPNSIVISGQRQVVESVVTELQQAGVKTKPLNVSHAFHSPLMEPMLAEFEQIASKICYSPPQIPLISNLTGTIATDEIATPGYWCRHVRQPVQFVQSMATLHQKKYELLVEIGPKPILLGMAHYCLPEGTGVRVPSLHPAREDWQQMLQSLATLYCNGASIDWAGFDRAYTRHRLPLPTYPFQRQRYWAELPESDTNGKHSAQDSLAHLLNSETLPQILQQITTTGQFSAEEQQLLPKLLQVLSQNQLQANSAIPEAIQDWFYEVTWQAKPLPPKTETTNGFHPPENWLIFSDSEGVGVRIAEQLKAQGHAPLLVYPGEQFQKQEHNIWQINPGDRADFDRLFQEIAADYPLQGIIHLWNLATPSAELTLASLDQAQAIGVGSVLHLLQALISHVQVRGSSNGNGANGNGANGNGAKKHNLTALPRLWLLTQGAIPIEEAALAVAQVPLWGLGRVIALEHPELWGGMIDLSAVVTETDVTETDVTETEVTCLLAEITANQREDYLAFRNGQRYIARLVRKTMPAAQPVALRSEDASYWITGGLGALGLQVAQWMVKQGARTLVLTGRRPASSQAQEVIRQLEQAGAKVLVMQADVAVAADVARVMETIEFTLPPLRGVIHAAGVLDDGILLQQQWQRFQRVMAPKVQGAWNLHQLTQQQPLDFFVLFSSAAALLGSPGQGNYAAANAFLDGLAHYRRALGLPALSLNWGAWSDAGMAANLNDRNQTRLAAQGLHSINPEQGLQALACLLGQSSSQVGVLPFDWSAFSQQFSPDRQPALLSDLLAGIAPSAAKTLSAHQEEFLQRLRAVSPDDRQTLLVSYLQHQVAKVLGLAASDLNPQQSLHELGMDSLMAVELVTLIRTELQVELPIRALMEDPSLQNLVALLVDQLSPGNASPTASTEERLDLQAEAALDPSIQPDATAIGPVEQPGSILLTGATGFLGAFLLQELLDQTSATIYCLVRSSDLDTAAERLQANLKTYDLWQEQYGSRIIPVLGDLAQPKLGLSDRHFEQLAEQIDVIYHNGALLNYVYPYSKFKPINVLGTQDVLRLACHTKIKPVHHISSVAVFESSAYYGQRVTESDPIDRSEGIYLGYSQSKWVSEKLVQIAGQRGLPVTIYRPPLVSGHSQTGVWNTSGFLCRMIKGCIQMGSIMADLDLMLDLSPVDYNSQAIVYLSRQQESLGKVFHLQNPRLLHWSELVDFISSLGYPMERISYEEWQTRLSQNRDNPLYPLLPFFQHQWADSNLTYIELNEQGYRPVIACEETLSALSKTSIACPPLDAQLLGTYFSYFTRSGFLQAPKVAIHK